MIAAIIGGVIGLVGKVGGLIGSVGGMLGSVGGVVGGVIGKVGGLVGGVLGKVGGLLGGGSGLGKLAGTGLSFLTSGSKASDSQAMIPVYGSQQGLEQGQANTPNENTAPFGRVFSLIFGLPAFLPSQVMQTENSKNVNNNNANSNEGSV